MAQIEHHLLRLLKELGATLIAGLSTLALPADPPRSLACACGHTATYQCYQKAQVTTLLGPITLSRPYYLCAACGHGQHPLDAHLQYCAGKPLCRT